MLDAFLLFAEKSKEHVATTSKKMLDLCEENDYLRRQHQRSEKQLDWFVGGYLQKYGEYLLIESNIYALRLGL